MPLNANVLVAEADVAAALGTTLAGSTYTIMGLAVPQANFQNKINQAANDETNALGATVYNSTDGTLGPAVKAFQVADSAYQIALSLKGYSATYFNFSAGDTRFDLALQHLDSFVKDLKVERDRQLNLVMSITPSDLLIDTQQPGYSQTASSSY